MNVLKESARVEAYLEGLLSPPDPVLDAALRASEAAGLPAIQVTALEGQLLMLLARAGGARTILEIGTLGGYSTIWLARALPPDGRLVTLEADSRHAEVAQANIARAGLSAVVEVRVGAALATLPALAAAGFGPVDLTFIDADKAGIPEYFAWALRLSREGSLIIVDNVIREGRVLETSSDDPDIRGIRMFLEMAGKEPRVSTTAIQTVGTKGYDGFAVSLVIQ